MPWQFYEDVPMSMKRIRSMSDPLLAQDAATKKYVDDKVGSGGGGGGNEVVIQANEPTDPLLELWVDYDAVGSPGGTGPDEVFIQNEAPLEEGAELWLDLDEDGPDSSLMETVSILITEVARLRSDLDALKGGA